jgi:hypothetical protein
MPVTSFYKVGSRMVGEQTDGGTRINYVTDALGSIVQAIDENRNTTYTARYKPFGDVLSSTGTAPAFTWVGSLGYLQAAGRPHSEFYVRARVYSKMEGRWTTVDPLWPLEPTYEYGSVAPVDSFDQTGKLSIKYIVPCQPYDLCGQAYGVGIWQLDPKESSFTGFIVQKISISYNGFHCKTNLPNGAGDACSPTSWFERWLVKAGKFSWEDSGAQGNGTDFFSQPTYGLCSWGVTSVKLEAKLIPFSDSSGQWSQNKEKGHHKCSGELATADSVPIWKSSTASFYRNIIVTWGCCTPWCGGDHCPGICLNPSTVSGC